MSDYNAKFGAITDKSAEVLKALMSEAQASILDTWAQVEAACSIPDPNQANLPLEVAE